MPILVVGLLSVVPRASAAQAVTVLPDVAVSQLAGVPTDGSKSSITLSDSGHYRVVGFRIVSGATTVGTLVIGVPLRQVDETILDLVGLAALFSLLVVTGTVFAARPVVVRSLRPLNRVAATAQQVSQLKLDRGEVAFAVRVPPEDANPASEVGRVGQALNHMLNNVEEALAARKRPRPGCASSWPTHPMNCATRLPLFADMRS